MKITALLSEALVVTELGQRVQQQRVGQNLTQHQLAQAAGVSARTIERLEAGRSIQVDELVRVLGALGLAENINQLVPANEIRPLQLVGAKAKLRQRASKRQIQIKTTPSGWVWGDEQ